MSTFPRLSSVFGTDVSALNASAIEAAIDRKDGCKERQTRLVAVPEVRQ